MARGRKKANASDTINQEIERAQQKVIKTKASYDKAIDELQKLLDKRDAQRKDEIWSAIIKSEKNYDEILNFISGVSEEVQQ